MEIGLVIFGIFGAMASAGRLLEEWSEEAWINKVLLIALAVFGVVLATAGFFRLVRD